MLATRNGVKSSNGAVSRGGLLATMKAQQAVAIRFVGRRVKSSTCLFFSLFLVCARRIACSSCLAIESFLCNGCAVVSSAKSLSSST